jgi:predicted CXXCH cytochrome family protein
MIAFAAYSGGQKPAQEQQVVKEQAAIQQAPVVVAAEYAGFQACEGCHQEIYDKFIKSGHAYKLNKVVRGKPPKYPFTEVPSPPEGYTWDDVTYVIGGYNWKARFIGKDGYIITGEEGNKEFFGQYNFANPIVGTNAYWAKYHPGEKTPYNCGACHTTGYSNIPEGKHQDGLPGLIGTWAEPGVKCEACHGPGSLHVEKPLSFPLLVDRDSESCGKCHKRGSAEAVNASGGFIRHHEQYEEIFQSKHITLKCVLCHDPHTGVVQLRKTGQQTTRTLCTNCHWEKEESQVNPAHKAMGLQCINCHMPRVTINPQQIGQFSEDGKTALSQIGLNFACRQCHVEGGDAVALSDEELIIEATSYHIR